MNSLEQFRDNDFGICKVLFRRSEKLEHVCLFASHTFSSFLPEYVYYYLNEIKKSNLSLVFISSSPISIDDLQKLTRFADIVIEKENKGTDFGAWCAALRWLNYGKNFQTLYLCNDSVFGPLSPLEEIHKKFYSENYDVLGITDSHQGIGYHIQSYFIGLKKSVLSSEVWESIWAQMSFHKDKQKVIEYYEIGLTEQLVNAGFKYFIWTNWSNKIGFHDILKKVSKSEELRPRWLNRVLYEQKDIVLDINPSSFLWKELITCCQNPFIKRELFIYNYLYEECEIEKEWENIIEQYTIYPTWLIKLFLVQYCLFKSVRDNLKEIAGFDISFHSLITKPAVQAEKKYFENIILFKALQSLLKLSDVKVSPGISAGLKQLDNLNVKYFPLVVSSQQTEDSFICTLLYLNHEIAAFDQVSRGKLKTAIKRVSNPVIIVPDIGSQAIVASLLSLRSDGVLLEKEFLIHSGNSMIAKYFISLFASNGDGDLILFQRPILSRVVSDAIKNENRTGFINKRQETISPVNSEEAFNANYYSSREDYLQYLNTKEKYSLLYENTPLWYKKIGQIIKVFKGRKWLSIKWLDKDKKDNYRPTTQDIAQWYYIQYEVLPSWYKKIGKSLVKKKNQA